jgi:hypothetical protein
MSENIKVHRFGISFLRSEAGPGPGCESSPWDDGMRT